MSVVQIRMPWGKYAGKLFDEIPLQYLSWLVAQDWLKWNIKLRLEEYLAQPHIQASLIEARNQADEEDDEPRRLP